MFNWRWCFVLVVVCGNSWWCWFVVVCRFFRCLSWICGCCWFFFCCWMFCWFLFCWCWCWCWWFCSYCLLCFGIVLFCVGWWWRCMMIVFGEFCCLGVGFCWNCGSWLCIGLVWRFLCVLFWFVLVFWWWLVICSRYLDSVFVIVVCCWIFVFFVCGFVLGCFVWLGSCVCWLVVWLGCFLVDDWYGFWNRLFWGVWLFCFLLIYG